MKIISKYKDYYDFLQGVNGIDEKIVLDRTEFHVTEKLISEDSFFRFHICGYKIEGLYRKGKFLYGKELEQYHIQKNRFFSKDNQDEYYCIKDSKSYGGNTIDVLKEPKKLEDGKNPNEYLNCPILIEHTFGKYECESDDYVYNYSWTRKRKYNKFPILKDHEINKVFSAEEIWIILYNWLSKEKTIENNQTDKEKIVSHGFDLKHSFRNTK